MLWCQTSEEGRPEAEPRAYTASVVFGGHRKTGILICTLFRWHDKADAKKRETGTGLVSVMPPFRHSAISAGAVGPVLRPWLRCCLLAAARILLMRLSDRAHVSSPITCHRRIDDEKNWRCRHFRPPPSPLLLIYTLPSNAARVCWPSSLKSCAAESIDRRTRWSLSIGPVPVAS